MVDERVMVERREILGEADAPRWHEKPSAVLLKADLPSQRGFIDWLMPVIRTRVARARGRSEEVAARWEVDELTQEVLALLFENEARVLMSWDRERGLSLKNYVGLVAERAAVRLLRVQRRARIVEDAQGAEADEVADSLPGPEAALATRQFAQVMLSRIRDHLSPRALRLFELLVVEELSIEEVCLQTGLSRDATYAWRSRLTKRARHVARELEDVEPNSCHL